MHAKYMQRKTSVAQHISTLGAIPVSATIRRKGQILNGGSDRLALNRIAAVGRQVRGLFGIWGSKFARTSGLSSFFSNRSVAVPSLTYLRLFGPEFMNVASLFRTYAVHIYVQISTKILKIPQT